MSLFDKIKTTSRKREPNADAERKYIVSAPADDLCSYSIVSLLFIDDEYICGILVARND